MTVIKPLQVICSSVACRRRQTVSGDRVWYVDVRKGPGSHREAGWTCRFCGMDNTTPPSHLPRNTIPMLASRQEVIDRLSKSVIERKGPVPRSNAPIPTSREAAVAVSTARKTDTIAAIPTTEAITLTDRSASRSDADRRIASAKGETGRAVPTWAVGVPARAIVVEALVRIAHHGGDAIAIIKGRNGFEGIKVDLFDDKDLDEAEIAAFVDSLMEKLDLIRADVVVLGGTVADRPWQAILHVDAGAASFV